MEPIISVIPSLDDNGKLEWEFTSKYSSVVDVNLLKNLEHVWNSTRSVLNKRISGADNSFKLSADDLIHDTPYPISMTITNSENSFFASDDITFVPNVCQWLEIEGG